MLLFGFIVRSIFESNLYSFGDVIGDHFLNCFYSFDEIAEMCKIAPRAGESSKIRVGEV